MRKVKTGVNQCGVHPRRLVDAGDCEGISLVERLHALFIDRRSLLFQGADQRPGLLQVCNSVNRTKQGREFRLQPDIYGRQVGGADGSFDLIEIQSQIQFLLKSCKRLLQLGSVQQACGCRGNILQLLKFARPGQRRHEPTRGCSFQPLTCWRLEELDVLQVFGEQRFQ